MAEQTAVKWRYVRAPGLEVLSCCNDWETRQFAAAFLLQDRKLREILPDSLGLDQSIPATMILVTAKVSKDMDDATKAKIAAPCSIVHQVSLKDIESLGMFYRLINGDAPAKNPASYFERILLDRTPPFPIWFALGEIYAYQMLVWSDDKPSLSPTRWLATNDRHGMPTVPVPILHMQEFFSDSYAKYQGDKLNLWRLQLKQFICWAFAGGHERREALWKFADASSKEAVSEALFQKCFGMDYVKAEKELMDFIVRERMIPVVVFDSGSIKLPEITVARDATTEEVARIKGDLDLKEAETVGMRTSAYFDQYMDQARIDLVGAYEKGSRDPAFLAVLGLYYSRIGDDQNARPVLEEATAGHVARPSVYVELARIRLAEAIAKPAGKDGKLGPEQMEQILGLLKESRRYAPAQAKAYDLAEELQNHSESSPDCHEFIADGRKLFPKNYDLSRIIVKLLVQMGSAPQISSR